MKGIEKKFKRAVARVKNVVKWARFGARVYDFDYHYAIEAFVLQLEAMADFMESDRAYTVEAKKHAQEIREAAEELKRVYDDEYALAYFDRLQEKWGTWEFVFEPTEQTFHNPISGKEEETYTMEKRFLRPMTPEQLAEYERDHKQWMEECRAEQERREDEIWQRIRHQIRGWWD
jgi:hypothetical protein